MSTPNPNVRFTYDDFQGLPESMAGHYELLDGDILMVPSPTTRHQIVAGNLAYLLQRHVRETGAGLVIQAPCDLVLGEGDRREVVEPDLMFISDQRRSIVTPKEIQGAPDLVAEVLSPGTERRDRGYKRGLYGRYGVSEYWVVDPSGCALEVYRLTPSGLALSACLSGDDGLQTDLLPGLLLPLPEVFGER